MSKLAMMKQAFEEILGDFYENGLPADVKPRQIAYLEKAHSVSVVTGMRRTGKTYFTYQRMKELLREGLPLNRIVHVNFDDVRLKGATVDDLRLLGDTHARLFPQAAAEKCLRPKRCIKFMRTSSIISITLLPLHILISFLLPIHIIGCWRYGC